MGIVGGRARILLVDDRRENLIALDAILSAIGDTTLIPVRSGEQALTELSRTEYAVVLLDVRMPGLDGFETARRIRAGTRNSSVPIIFLSAASTRPDATFRGYTSGAVDYLAKPFDPWVLTAKVSIFVALYLRQLDRAELLTERIGAIEEAVALMTKLPALTADPAAQDALADLQRLVANLRTIA